MTEVKIKGTVEKVVRAFRSTDTQVTITVPVSTVSEIPLGAVSIQIQTLQSAMFPKSAVARGDEKKDKTPKK